MHFYGILQYVSHSIIYWFTHCHCNAQPIISRTRREMQSCNPRASFNLFCTATRRMTNMRNQNGIIHAICKSAGIAASWSNGFGYAQWKSSHGLANTHARKCAWHEVCESILTSMLATDRYRMIWLYYISDKVESWCGWADAMNSMGFDWLTMLT